MISVVSNPEFLREGSAVSDFLHPDRIVLGGDSTEAIDRVAEVYRPIAEQSFEGGDPTSLPPVMRASRATAETIKYAANAFLATKISFINEMANIADLVGADITEIAAALGMDHRISSSFFHAGVGWGGSCFGKDLAAISSMAKEYGYEPLLLDAVRTVNTNQRHNVIRKLQMHLRPIRGRRVALLGLAFKPNTDDTRDAPAVTIAQSLEEKGAIVRAYDPMVKEIPGLPNLKTTVDPYTALEGADAAVLVTEWAEFLQLDLHEVARRMRPGALILDGRNALDAGAVTAAGLRYAGFGLPPVH
jgi:nucleotide sugar dehydrogenase